MSGRAHSRSPSRAAPAIAPRWHPALGTGPNGHVHGVHPDSADGQVQRAPTTACSASDPRIPSGSPTAVRTARLSHRRARPVPRHRHAISTNPARHTWPHHQRGPRPDLGAAGPTREAEFRAGPTVYGIDPVDDIVMHSDDSGRTWQVRGSGRRTPTSTRLTRCGCSPRPPPSGRPRRRILIGADLGRGAPALLMTQTTGFRRATPSRRARLRAGGGVGSVEQQQRRGHPEAGAARWCRRPRRALARPHGCGRRWRRSGLARAD